MFIVQGMFGAMLLLEAWTLKQVIDQGNRLERVEQKLSDQVASKLPAGNGVIAAEP